MIMHNRHVISCKIIAIMNCYYAMYNIRATAITMGGTRTHLRPAIPS